MEKYITIKEYAKQKGKAVSTIYNWINRGDLPVIKKRGVYYVLED